MASSTSNLDLITQSQASKEVTANALLDALSPASLYGRRSSTTSGLTWGFYGGYALVNNVSTLISNGTLTLTASTTCYLVAARVNGAVSFSTATTNWNNTAAFVRLYSVVTGSSSVTSYLDFRSSDVRGMCASGIYTPTLTNVANLDGSTAYACQYARVGQLVTVTGRVDLDPTAGALVQLGISLPIASNLANLRECAGTAVAPAVAYQCAAIVGDGANDRAELQYTAVDLTNQPFYFAFSYQVI